MTGITLVMVVMELEIRTVEDETVVDVYNDRAPTLGVGKVVNVEIAVYGTTVVKVVLAYV